jgi:hypothetical protein
LPKEAKPVMRIKTVIATSATTALLLTPAFAYAAGGPPADPGTDHPSAQSQPSNDTPGPHASAKAKRKAYGTYCATESRKHVAGEHGTPFSKCVTAMAKLATGKTDNPRAACKTLSKKHVAGEHGTPFSKCVSGAAKLRKDQEQADEDESSDDGSSTTEHTGTDA